MVSLELKLTYLQSINDTAKLTAFHNFLIGTKFQIDKYDSIEGNQLFFDLISAFQNNDKVKFLNLYDKKSKSNPNKEHPLPFVNDDFFLFVLIEGIIKFGIDKSWINKILSIRQRNDITITFENILNENFLSKSNLMTMVLVHSHLNQTPVITDELLNDSYNEITNKSELLQNKNDFEILCALQAYDLIILNKMTPERSDINLLNQFNKHFLKRIKVITWIIQVILLFVLLFFLLKIFILFPEYGALVNKYGPVFSVLGALGFTFLGNLIPSIKTKSQEFILLIFGYPKELIKRNKN